MLVTPEDITAGLPTISAKIRALHKAGYPRAEIARILGRRYQQVRNVLVQDAQVASRKDKVQTTEPANVKVGPEGRIVIPSSFRQAMRIAEGDFLIATLREGEVVLSTKASAIRKAQALVRQIYRAISVSRAN